MTTEIGADTTFVDITDNNVLVTATYVVKGWLVHVEWDIGSPFDGPSSVRVMYDEQSLDHTVGSAGINVDVLRAIPMRDASQRIANHVASRAVDGLPAVDRVLLTGRATSPAEHAQFAALYVRAHEIDGVQNPVRHLTEMSQHLARTSGGKPLTRSGVSARIKRARDMNLLNRDTDHPALTEEGSRLLKD